MSFLCPLSSAGTEAPEELILRKFKVVLSLILLSLLAFKELVYPFSWPQQGLTTELSGNLLKRCVQEDFQMPDPWQEGSVPWHRLTHRPCDTHFLSQILPGHIPAGHEDVRLLGMQHE